MSDEMFCFQCEQTARGTGCTGRAGVCGKPAATAVEQDQLSGSLISLAQAYESREAEDDDVLLVLEGLFTTITNVNFDEESVHELAVAVQARTGALGGDPAPYDMTRIWAHDDEDIRSLKALLFFGLKGMAAYTHHAWVLGQKDAQVNAFFFTALRALGDELAADDLLQLVMECGRVNLRAMELLDAGNTGAYGDPEPTTVSLTIAKGPFIVITGHDLHDLYRLLEQTEGLGINVYTHGEMLPAHAYPELKRFAHLKGNFGTAWQNQQKEFAAIPAPVLYTTNCIMPVRDSYRDRIFTTAVVRYPGMVHIGPEKDFTPLIEKARELGGYETDTTVAGINGGTTVTTGFGHAAVLGVADKVVEAVKSGAIKHFFLVGGCDGAKPGRNYYTEFVQATPNDSVVLTLSCGKFRFNDLDLGTTTAGLPRLLDMGQCNDSYSAIRVALALADAFDCEVNDLPLSLVLSWYEQKAVCVLLTLLSLGIKGIVLGPSLPAFVSPNILDYLVKNLEVAPTTSAAADLERLLTGTK